MSGTRRRYLYQSLFPYVCDEARGKKESAELREKSHCLSVINLHALALSRSLGR